MKKYALLSLIFLLVTKSLLCGEVTNKPLLTINLGLGLAKKTTTDLLLNYFQYTGTSFLPVTLETSYSHNKNIFLLSMYYHSSKLSPVGLRPAYYAYNYVQHFDAEFNLAYYRTSQASEDHIQIAFGAINYSGITLQAVYYKNNLYDFAQGYRKAYNISLINIYSVAMITAVYSKICLRIRAGYSLLNLAARPSDNYVKQIGLNDGLHWTVYSVRHFQSFQLSAHYQYNVSNTVGITAEYAMMYRTYKTPVQYQYLRQVYLLGISKSF